MSIFKRLFKIGQAEAHNIVDKLEDPIKLTEQGIRDLKVDLDNSLKAYAEVKAIAIKARKEAAEAKNLATSFEQKAVLLIQKAEKGELAADEADRLATEALVKKQEAESRASAADTNATSVDKNLVQLEQNIKKLKANISHYENELKTLKARAKVSQATSKLNKQMANIDSNGTVAMLEKMKTKVTESEALAEAYGDMAEQNKSVDDQINEALGGAGATRTQASSDLEALKSKLKGGQSQ